MTDEIEYQFLRIDTEARLDAWNGEVIAWNAWGARHGGEEFEPLDPDMAVRPTLSGEAAMALWRRGRGDWNQWVEVNPNADVDFDKQTFEPNAREAFDIPLVDFRNLHFPNGRVSFKEASFGDADVSFYRTQFGDGDTSFASAEFGNGSVNFMLANLGNGNTSFFAARFGNGSVSFDYSYFGKGEVDFGHTGFGEGEVSFQQVKFLGIYIDFSHADFGNGPVFFNGAILRDSACNFSRTLFSEGRVEFAGVPFGHGRTDFSFAMFRDCEVIFTGADFGESLVDFNLATFHHSDAVFELTTFRKRADFEELRGLQNSAKFSFKGALFEGPLSFSLFEPEKGKSNAWMACPIDLRNTSLEHDIVVQDIRCDFAKAPRPDWSAGLANWLFAVPLWPHLDRSQKSNTLPPKPKPKWSWYKIADEREDSQRFRRLKELAVSNRNHTKALEFHALELQAARGHDVTGFTAWLHRLYALTSDYGRSVVRPAVGLAVCWGVFAALFWDLREPFIGLPETVATRVGDTTPSIWAAMSYSASNMFAFIPTGGAARQQAVDLLFRGFLPWDVIFLSGVQTLLSGVLLFLLGLGLRNMFRV